MAASIRVRDGGLSLGDRHVPLLSGEIHFWRHDPDYWDALLAQVAAEEIPLVSTYLSWRRHEPSPTNIDLYGRTDPRLDVGRFLTLCSKHGLLVQLKPGPWICAEEKGGGYPDWLLADTDLWELDADGKPVLGYNPPFQHPVPCYLHPRYLRASKQWLQAVGERIRELVWPDGPVVMVQLDNEPSHCFRDGFTEAGHHPITMAAFRRRAWDWAEFHGWLLAEHLREIRMTLMEAGLHGVAFSVNYNDHPVPTVPQDPATLRESVQGVGGPDLYYVPPLRREDIVRLALWAALTVPAEPAPWVPEAQAGIWRSPGVSESHPDPTPAEQRFWYLAALAFGFRGLNFYMLASRENWALAPLDSEGQPSPFLESVRAAVRVIRSFPDWGSMRPVPSTLMAWPAADLRRAWMGQGDADQRVRQTFQDLFDAGLIVSTRTGSEASTGLPIVDPMSSLPHSHSLTSPMSASAGALTVIQRGIQSTAIFVLNPSTANVHVELRGCQQGLHGRLVPVTEVGSRPAADRRELDLEPWGLAVYRLEQSNG